MNINDLLDKTLSSHTLNFWFEDDYVVEIKENKTPRLFEFEPCTEHYLYRGDVPCFLENLAKNNGYFKFKGKKHLLVDIEVMGNVTI